MLIETAKGLVLHTYPLTETSLIVHWLTQELGRIATVAKGARRPKSLFRGKLDLFYLADFSFNRSRRSELHNLREVLVRDAHSALRHEMAYLQQASYCVRLIELATETETPLPAIFDLLDQLLQNLPQQTPKPQTIFAFELKLLEQLGLEPDVAQSPLTNGAQAIVRMLGEADWPTIFALHMSTAQSLELGEFLHGFLIYHLGRLAKGRESAIGVSHG